MRELAAECRDGLGKHASAAEVALAVWAVTALDQRQRERSG